MPACLSGFKKDEMIHIRRFIIFFTALWIILIWLYMLVAMMMVSIVFSEWAAGFLSEMEMKIPAG
ncbi:hypothetical protein [Brenneria goodwinii]|uniref:hypothetical protein n=1 Tax=Brenneria goodwinii TaxID=1109412 RepID=UPI0011C405AF|nr:hypothetical protein [Brenneria goodwinii]